MSYPDSYNMLLLLESARPDLYLSTSILWEAPTDTIKKVIDLTDVFLLDIKCINDEICKDLTGVSNKRELEFARYLSDHNKDMWIRQVLVPGYTDKEEDLKKLKEFLSTLKTVKKIEILPYHDLGKFKWLELGLKYELEGVRVANSDDVDRARKILRYLRRTKEATLYNI